MFAVVVKFEIKLEHLDAFIPMMLENARASVRDEVGCHQFDVCSDPDRPGEVFLYELYDDEAAFKTHMTMPHFLKFDAGSAEMIASKTVHTYAEVAQ